jgi:hypothetical protein
MLYSLKYFPVVVLAILMSACAHKVPLKSPIPQKLAIEKEPISVAIFYSEGLRHHKCNVSKGYIADSWTIELGRPSMEMFNLVFDALFEKVVILDSKFNTQSSNELKSMIEVRLLDFNGCEARWPIIGTNIEVAYEATLYGKEGVIVAKWQGRGRGLSSDSLESYKEKVPLMEVETRYLGALTSIAMRRAAANFIFNFYTNSLIRTWLGK